LRPVALLGGTFDPVHVGHLRAALEIRDALGLGQVRLVPARVPPHRPQPQAGAEQRLALLRLAVRGVPGLTVDERELRRDGPSYTVDTLSGLRAELGRRPLCLLVGDDAFRGLPDWHRWEALPASLQQALHGRRADDPQALFHRPAGLVWQQPVPPLDISATRIRSLLKAGASVRFLVPDACLRYIRHHHLYTD
jgi:nicotinate-nucleotide adenylyltransferase